MGGRRNFYSGFWYPGRSKTLADVVVLATVNDEELRIGLDTKQSGDTRDHLVEQVPSPHGAYIAQNKGIFSQRSVSGLETP